MKSNKKGQGAMEYLMTYGWAIIVVMIVGLALWNLGIFNLGKTYPKGFSGFSAVRPLDWQVDNTSKVGYSQPVGTLKTVFEITLVNGEDSRIRPLTMIAEGQCTTEGGEVPFQGSQFIEPGKELPVYLINSWGAFGPQIVFTCTNVAVGEPYNFKVIISYNKTLEGGLSIIHRSVGRIWGTFDSFPG